MHTAAAANYRKIRHVVETGGRKARGGKAVIVLVGYCAFNGNNNDNNNS